MIITGSLLSVQTSATDWPQWRGPNRDGVWQEKGIVQKFDSPRLPIRWRVKIANGYSGPTVANGRVYVTDRSTDPTQIERVHCFDAMTSESIWSHSYECKYKGFAHRDGPRAAVTVNNNLAYSLGAMGHFFCFAAAKGDVLWSKDLYTEYKIKMPTWGIAAAPLVEDELVIVHIGGRENACLVGFDKITGKEKWRALNDPASYSAPIVIEQAGKRQQLACAKERHKSGDVCIFEPLTGKFVAQFKEKADRLYVADVTGDWREEIIVLNGSELHIYQNTAHNPRPNQKRLWANRNYRRLKQCHNYYSP